MNLHLEIYYNSSASFEDLCVFKYANIQKILGLNFQ